MRRRGAGSVGRWADARDMEEAGRLPDGSANGILHHLEFRLVLARFVFLLRCRFQVTNDLFGQQCGPLKGQDTSLALVT